MIKYCTMITECYYSTFQRNHIAIWYNHVLNIVDSISVFFLSDSKKRLDVVLPLYSIAVSLLSWQTCNTRNPVWAKLVLLLPLVPGLIKIPVRERLIEGKLYLRLRAVGTTGSSYWLNVIWINFPEVRCKIVNDEVW